VVVLYCIGTACLTELAWYAQPLSVVAAVIWKCLYYSTVVAVVYPVTLILRCVAGSGRKEQFKSPDGSAARGPAPYDSAQASEDLHHSRRRGSDQHQEGASSSTFHPCNIPLLYHRIIILFEDLYWVVTSTDTMCC